jgi:hypothetical protein
MRCGSAILPASVEMVEPLRRTVIGTVIDSVSPATILRPRRSPSGASMPLAAVHCCKASRCLLEPVAKSRQMPKAARVSQVDDNSPEVTTSGVPASGSTSATRTRFETSSPPRRRLPAVTVQIRPGTDRPRRLGGFVRADLNVGKKNYMAVRRRDHRAPSRALERTK